MMKFNFSVFIGVIAAAVIYNLVAGWSVLSFGIIVVAGYLFVIWLIHVFTKKEQKEDKWVEQK